MKRLNRIIIFGLVFVFLSGCTAFELRDANDMLVNLCTTKIEMDQKEYNLGDQMLLRANINESLIQLAKDAAEEADKTSTNRLNKIAFYRIAATASWQAMTTTADDTRKKDAQERILKYSKEGFSLCTNANDAPRDCGMLLVIPTLAGIDQYKESHEKINEKIRNETATDAEVIQLFDTEISALKDLLEKYEQVSLTDIPPAFSKHIHSIMQKDYCQRVTASLTFLRCQLGYTDDIYMEKSQEIDSVKAKLIEKGIIKKTFKCHEDFEI